MANFDDLRRDYSGQPLDEAAADADPLALFDRWFQDSVSAGIELANGMVLSTCSADGRPSSRVVLLKDYGPSGLVFYSNYDSRKGIELAVNPAAALLFWWRELARQIRIEGRVSRLDATTSDAYFATRPRASNLSATASVQSQSVDCRQTLVDRVAALEAEIGTGQPVRPSNWGGYVLIPDSFEFWQGREDRLHDRLRYQLGQAGHWTRERLCP